MIENQERFNKAIAMFDAANGEDPNQDQGRPRNCCTPSAMTEMLQRFRPDASEAVQLAVRAQHIRRWTVPRSSYPMTKEGYYAWRTGLYKIHADTAGELMRQAGYDDAMIEQVKKAVGKRALRSTRTRNCWRTPPTSSSSSTTCSPSRPANPTTTKKDGWRSSARPGKRCPMPPTPSPSPAASSYRNLWYL